MIAAARARGILVVAVSAGAAAKGVAVVVVIPAVLASNLITPDLGATGAR